KQNSTIFRRNAADGPRDAPPTIVETPLCPRPAVCHPSGPKGRLPHPDPYDAIVANCHSWRLGASVLSAAKPQPNGAKRMECAELAPAFEPRHTSDSRSKLHALHTLRETRPPSSSVRAIR